MRGKIGKEWGEEGRARDSLRERCKITWPFLCQTLLSSKPRYRSTSRLLPVTIVHISPIIIVDCIIMLTVLSPSPTVSISPPPPFIHSRTNVMPLPPPSHLIPLLFRLQHPSLFSLVSSPGNTQGGLRGVCRFVVHYMFLISFLLVLPCLLPIPVKNSPATPLASRRKTPPLSIHISVINLRASDVLPYASPYGFSGPSSVLNSSSYRITARLPLHQPALSRLHIYRTSQNTHPIRLPYADPGHRPPCSHRTLHPSSP